MNAPTLIVLLVVLILAVVAVRAMRRSGKGDACGSPCSGCSCRDLCGKRKD